MNAFNTTSLTLPYRHKAFTTSLESYLSISIGYSRLVSFDHQHIHLWTSPIGHFVPHHLISGTNYLNFSLALYCSVSVTFNLIVHIRFIISIFVIITIHHSPHVSFQTHITFTHYFRSRPSRQLELISWTFVLFLDFLFSLGLLSSQFSGFSASDRLGCLFVSFWAHIKQYIVSSIFLATATDEIQRILQRLQLHQQSVQITALTPWVA